MMNIKRIASIVGTGHFPLSDFACFASVFLAFGRSTVQIITENAMKESSLIFCTVLRPKAGNTEAKQAKSDKGKINFRFPLLNAK